MLVLHEASEEPLIFIYTDKFQSIHGERQKAISVKLCFNFSSVRMQFGGKHRDRSLLKSNTRLFKSIVDILFTKKINDV